MKEETLRKIEKWNTLNKIEREIASQGYANPIEANKLTLEDCYKLSDEGYEVYRSNNDKSKLTIGF